MNDLDPRGLEAARAQAIDFAQWVVNATKVGDSIQSEEWASRIVAAYLAATRTSDALRKVQRMGQECERDVDRIAVVINGDGRALGLDMLGMPPGRPNWRGLEMDAEEIFVMQGPFARAIVECYLPWPAGVATVEGVVRGE